MRVLLAFDKFKDALTAHQACTIAADALRSLHPDWTLDVCPLADGGEGFAEILTAAAGGTVERRSVTGPRGQPVQATFGLVAWEKLPAPVRARLGFLPQAANGRIAVIEMAQASGLGLLPPAERDPWQTTTAGTGELIRAAAGTGVDGILLGVGGSATNDLGLGALAALGLEFLGNGGRTVRPIPAAWPGIQRISGAIAGRLPPIAVACDSTSPLLGPGGAAAVYGAQKGLRAEDRRRLEHESARLALMLCAHCGQPDALIDASGSGAAGGLSFGLRVATGARILPGAELVAAWLDVERRLTGADIVLTGEGRFDVSSLAGKGPGAIVKLALRLHKPVHVFAGAFAAAVPDECHAHAITPTNVPLTEALASSRHHLETAIQTAFRI